MRIIFSCLAAAAAILGASTPASADITVKDGLGASRQIASFVSGNVHTYADALVDSAGARVDPATKQLQQQMITNLGSPLQAGGSVSISGPLPAFQTPPTVNLGTIAGAATEATLAAAKATLGSPSDTKSTATDATPATQTALLKGQIDRLGAIIAALGNPAQAGGKVDTVIQGAATDTGGLVGTTAVTLIPANAARRGFSLQIQTPGVTCYFSGLGAATADYHSLMLVSPSAANGGSGAYYESKESHVGTAAISVVCSAANTAVYSRTW